MFRRQPSPSFDLRRVGTCLRELGSALRSIYCPMHAHSPDRLVSSTSTTATLVPATLTHGGNWPTGSLLLNSCQLPGNDEERKRRPPSVSNYKMTRRVSEYCHGVQTVLAESLMVDQSSSREGPLISNRFIAAAPFEAKCLNTPAFSETSGGGLGSPNGPWTIMRANSLGANETIRALI